MWINFNFTLISLTFSLYFWKKLNFIIIEAWTPVDSLSSTNPNELQYLILNFVDNDQCTYFIYTYWLDYNTSNHLYIYLIIILLLVLLIVFIKTYSFLNFILDKKHFWLNNVVYLKTYHITGNKRWLYVLRKHLLFNVMVYTWYWRIKKYNGCLWYWSQLVIELKSIRKRENKLLRYTIRKFFKKSKYFLKQRKLLYSKLGDVFLFSNNFKSSYTLYNITISYYAYRFPERYLWKFYPLPYKTENISIGSVPFTVLNLYNMIKVAKFLHVKQFLRILKFFRFIDFNSYLFLFYVKDITKFRMEYFIYLIL